MDRYKWEATYGEKLESAWISQKMLSRGDYS